MREGHISRSKIDGAPGITPAYAGRTYTFERIGVKMQDHPRLCGKDIVASSLVALSLGSPPLMREGRNGRKVRAMHYRITPAYAGRTLSVTSK